jgi:soluble lytic murein transglycosylase-like protein
MSKAIIIKLIIFYAGLYGVNPKLALAVCETESNFNPNAISQTQDVGLFQLHEQSFPQFSKAQLLQPEINIPAGILYLKKMKKECKFKKENEWLACYNLGKRKASKIHYPAKWPYVKKVSIAMENF